MTIVNNPGAIGTPAGLAIAEEAQTLVTEANANTQAMIDTSMRSSEPKRSMMLFAQHWIRSARSLAGHTHRTGPSIRWKMRLVFSIESGRVDDEFQRLTRTARFREGEGLNGRSWRLRDAVSRC